MNYLKLCIMLMTISLFVGCASIKYITLESVLQNTSIDNSIVLEEGEVNLEVPDIQSVESKPTIVKKVHKKITKIIKVEKSVEKGIQKSTPIEEPNNTKGAVGRNLVALGFITGALLGVILLIKFVQKYTKE